MNLRDKQRALIEKIGVSLEGKGYRPAVARIIGLLYVADEPAVSFEQIVEALQLSKSAISTSLNMLLHNQQLEYITYPGDRKRYFKLKMNNWQEGLLQQVKNITNFSMLLRQVLENRTEETPEFNEQLRELSSFMEFVSDRLPDLLQEWKKKDLNLSY